MRNCQHKEKTSKTIKLKLNYEIKEIIYAWLLQMMKTVN